VKRREFIVGLGATVVWPLTARAQQRTPLVGVLHSGAAAGFSSEMAAFHQGLKDAGYIEGQNVTLEFRWGNSRPDVLPQLANDLVQMRPAVIVTMGGNAPVLAAKAATTTIPIVFNTGADPVRAGLVASLNRPGGNVTGISIFTGELGSKRLELLRDIVPQASTIAVLLNPNTPTAATERNVVEAAASKIGRQIVVLSAGKDRDLELAFATIAQRRPGALIVGASAFFNSRAAKIVALSARQALPTMFFQRESVVAGGLMSYGTNLGEAYRQAGGYTGRILKGEKAADLPVIQASKFEFVVNLKTAKTLGIDIHPQLLATADEVIE